VGLVEGDGVALGLDVGLTVGLGLASALALKLELGDSVTDGLAPAGSGVNGLLDAEAPGVVSSDPVRASNVTSVVGDEDGSDAGD